MTSVFLSYAREDTEFVRRLYEALTRIGHSPAWDQDHGVVPVGSMFREEIATAIAEAEKFVFVMSPDSLDSRECNDELRAALDGHKQVIPVMRRPAWFGQPIRPELAQRNWLFLDDDGRFDTGVAQLSEVLSTDLDWVRMHTLVLTRERRWVEAGSDRGGLLRGADLQAAQAWLADAATHPEIPPTANQRRYIALSQRAAARFRRNVRIALAGGLAVALALGIFGLTQRNHANTAHTQQLAAKLAGTSGSLLGTNLPEAQLLAVEAYRLEQDPQTLTALFQAVTFSPALVRFLPAGGPVSALGTAADGRSVVAGTSDGRVVRWSVRGGPGVTLARLCGQVAAVASDAAGTLVAAATTSRLSVWSATGGSRQIALPRTGSISAVGVSPSGRYIAAAAGSGAVLYDRRTGTARSVAAGAQVYAVAMPSDSRLVVAGGGGSWQVLTLPGLADVVGPTTLSTGVHQILQVLSANGRFESYSNGGATLPIWDTAHTANLGTPQDLTGLSHGSTPQALSISTDGRRVAVADSGTIYVSGTSRGTAANTDQLSLPGAGRTTAVQFLGDDDHLVTATGSSLALWDLDQPGRIGTRTQVEAPAGCSACAAPLTDISPDGKLAATLPGFMQDVYVHSMAPGGTQYAVIGGPFGGYQLLGWNRSSSEIFLIKDGTTFEALRVGSGMPVVEQQPIPRSAYEILAYSPASRRYIELADSGSVRIVPRSGAGSVLDVASPVPPGDSDVKSDVDPTSSYLAEEYQSPQLHREMSVIDLKTGHTRQAGSGDVTDFSFSGGYLVIQRANRNVEIWNTAGTARKYLVRLDPSVTDPRDPLVAGSMLIEESSNGALAATQLGTGKFLGDLPAPVTLPDTKTGLSTSPAGQPVAVTEGEPGDNEGTLVRWDISPSSWIRDACAAAGRSMTPADWQQYADGSAPGPLACAT
jgi:WD40 repeat protein